MSTSIAFDSRKNYVVRILFLVVIVYKGGGCGGIIEMVFAANGMSLLATRVNQERDWNVLLPVQLESVLELAISDISNLVILLRKRHMQQDVENRYMQWFLNSTKKPKTVQQYDLETLRAATNRDSFVVATNMQQLRRVAERLVQRAGIFFFVLEEFKDNDMVHLEELLLSVCKALWQRFKVFKTYMLTTDEVIWVYDPFEYNVALGSYGSMLRFDEQSVPLEDFLFRDMRGYPLRIQMFRSVYSRPHFDKITKQIAKFEGVDAQVAHILQQRLNFTTILQNPDPNYFGERDETGKYNGAIGSIMEDGLDICLTGFFIKDYLVSDYMDFTVAVYDDELCIYVPKAKRIPQSILPIFAVGYEIWLGFIMTAFVCAGIWLIFRIINLYTGIVRFQRGKGLWHQTLRIINDTWVLWVRVNIERFPTSYSERIFIASLCLVSVIFGAIFDSSLATVYIHPLHYKDINSLHELDESGLKVVYKYTSMADDLFFSETSKLFASLNKKLTWVSDLNADVILEVATTGGKAGVTRHTSLLLESLHFTMSKRVFVVPECPKYYTMSYVMPKDAPWEATVNDLLLRILNAGIIRKWINDMQTKVNIETRNKLIEYAESNSFRVLTIGDLQLAFYVVLCGNLLALLSLGLEKFLARRRRLRQVKLG